MSGFIPSRAQSVPAPFVKQCEHKHGAIDRFGVGTIRCFDEGTRMIITGERTFFGETFYTIVWLCERHDRERYST